MLKAKTKEQREHVESIVKKRIHHLQDCCFFEDAKLYLNCQELVEINLTCLDCDSSICVDIPFDMMAEIVDYLREQNKEVM